jgi:hypothetical protein
LDSKKLFLGFNFQTSVSERLILISQEFGAQNFNEFQLGSSMINNNYYCNMLASKITVKQVLYAVLALILTYLGFLRPILLKADFAATIEDMQCQDIWDYMADFR